VNDLTRLVSEHEKFHIGEQCEKLFLLQDKPMNEKKKALLVEEILATGFPYQAIVAGLSDLMHQDLRLIKIHTILESIQEKLTYREADTGVTCTHCGSSGYVSLFDKAHRYFALACVCEKGERRVSVQHLNRWNGLGIQHSNGRDLHRP
jgi:hypothetical protein